MLNALSLFTFYPSPCIAVIAGRCCLHTNESYSARSFDVTPVSAGSYDRFLNLQIALIISMQLLMCLFCSVASYIWREHSGKERYHLGMNQYVQVNPLSQCVICDLVGRQGLVGSYDDTQHMCSVAVAIESLPVQDTYVMLTFLVMRHGCP